MTSVVLATATNPPLAMPLTFTGPIRLDNAISVARVAGLAPQTVNRGFDNSYVQSWNLNVQRELTTNLALMAGYFGSKGTHLIIRRNINQPINGLRPYPELSASSPILPGAPLGNITQAESTGNSSYNALWVTANQRYSETLCSMLPTRGRSRWTTSRSVRGGIVVQNSDDLRGDRGLSDFDVRHRFVVSAIYDLPFRGNQFVDGWQLSWIFQAQSGNPVNIVTSNSTVNGVSEHTAARCDGPINILAALSVGSILRYSHLFRASATWAATLSSGPGFNNTDFSVSKNTTLGEKLRLQFRAEFFDLFNHANLGQPGNIVGTPDFGRITNTRFPTGESGSSRQVQFAVKLIF